MKMRLVVMAFFMMSIMSLQALAVCTEWSKTFGGGTLGSDSANGIAQDSAYVYATGSILGAGSDPTVPKIITYREF